MKKLKFPVSRQQKQFEDLAQTLLKVTADLMEENQNLLLEYAFSLDAKEKEEQHKRGL